MPETHLRLTHLSQGCGASDKFSQRQCRFAPTAQAEAALPIHQPPNPPSLPLTGDELLFVTQRNKPALAAQSAHLAHMIDVHQRAAVDALKVGAAQPLLQHLQRLGSLVSLARGGDPDYVALGMEGENLAGVQ